MSCALSQTHKQQMQSMAKELRDKVSEWCTDTFEKIYDEHREAVEKELIPIDEGNNRDGIRVTKKQKRY